MSLILDTNWLISFDWTNLIIWVQPLSHNQGPFGLIKDMDLTIYNYCTREILINLIQYLVRLNQFLYMVNQFFDSIFRSNPIKEKDLILANPYSMFYAMSLDLNHNSRSNQLNT